MATDFSFSLLTCQRQLLPEPRLEQQERTFSYHQHCHHNGLQIDSTIRRSLPTSSAAGLLLLILLFLTASDIQQLTAVKIRHQSISQVVDGSNFSSVLLDCDYTYDPGDIKLVVRWFFNDAPEPIYQWIPSSDTRYVGELLRPFFDLDHRLGEDRFTKYRAIRLVNKKLSANLEDKNQQQHLPVTLAGKYVCLISSINSQDSRHGQLVVYVPPKKFEFSLLTSEEAAASSSLGDFLVSPEESSNGGPLLRCSVDSVFPKPLLTFSELNTGNGSPVPPQTGALPQVFPSVEVATSVNESTGLFSSAFTYRLPPESIKVGTVYECKLELPGTSASTSSSSSFSTSTFTRKKRIKLIYPSTYNYPNRAYEQPNADNNWFSWSTNGGNQQQNAHHRPSPPSLADYQMHSKTLSSNASNCCCCLRFHWAFFTALFTFILVHLFGCYFIVPSTDLMR